MAYSNIFINTDAIDQSQRDDFWREVTRPVCDTTRVTSAGDTSLEGTMLVRPVGGLTLGSTTFNAQHYVRDKRIIAQGGLDHYLLQVLVAGSIKGDFAGRDVAAAPGDICVIDLARTYKSEVDSGARLTIAIPRKDLEKVLGNRDLHGLVLKAGQPLTRLLVDYLQGLHKVSGELSPSEGIAAHDALVTLLAAGFTGAPTLQAGPKSELNLALRERILTFIENHLTSLDMGPELLMQRFRISRAHLYRAFAEDGGIVSVIRDKRLHAAFRALIDPRKATRSAAAIAGDFGFSNPTKFHKTFVTRFGITPDEAREQGRSVASATEESDGLSHHFAAYDTLRGNKADNS
jgi:AraC-like DNA-binding protein